MKRILYYSLVLLTAGNGMLQAQNWIHGKVVDKEERPVDGVAVVLQTLDSTYIDAVVTDSLGAFMLNKEAGPNYRCCSSICCTSRFVKKSRLLMPVR